MVSSDVPLRGKEDRKEMSKKDLAFLLLVVVFIGGCATKLLVIGNQFGKTEYETGWEQDVYCWETLNPATNSAVGCCCDPAMEDRSIIDVIHRCGH